MKKLPVGIQSFNMIQAKELLYVDKTKYLYDLISGYQGFYFFLSRPRRFGKSLLISTFKELFSGNKNLFKDLWIYESDYDWKSYPVIQFDFSSMASRSPEELRIDLSLEIDQIGKSHNIDTSSLPSPEAKLKYLIRQLSMSAGVVVLIDEYDKPLLNHVNNMAIMQEMQAVLSGFYSVLKAVGDHIHFLFMTGVTKFSKTSVFSGLNNLTDLTLSEHASTLLGYTEQELNTYFTPYMQQIAKERSCSIDIVKDDIRYWYNGYQFSKESEKVYNPFSVLSYLQSSDLRNYWFETGTPTFLVNLIREKKYKIEDLERVEVNIDDLNSYDIDKMKLVPLLLQTGYLTIKSYNQQTSNYRLGYPNEETKASFLLYFMDMVTEIDAGTVKNKTLSLTNALAHGNLQEFFDILKVFFASIPYDTQLAKEQYYQSIFYVILSLMDVYTAVEVRTNNGRIDCIVIMDTRIHILEFKLTGTDIEALEQIESKKYYEKFLHEGKEIVLVGVAFDQHERNIKSWSSRVHEIKN